MPNLQFDVRQLKQLRQQFDAKDVDTALRWAVNATTRKAASGTGVGAGTGTGAGHCHCHRKCNFLLKIVNKTPKFSRRLRRHS